MRTIIISDLNNGSESIIPYGLNVGKHTETTVDVIHIIDPRSNHGVSSNYSDSQTITPGHKLSHSEILEREKSIHEKAMDKLLSSEPSRLNYPLKVNRIIKIEDVANAFRKELQRSTDQMIITNRHIEKTFFEDFEDIYQNTKDIQVLIMVVPSGMKFKNPNKALFLTDFSESSHPKMQLLFKWINPFKVLLNACNVVKMKEMIEAELRMETWKKAVERYTESPALIKTNTIQGDNYIQTLINYIARNEHDLLILPKTNLKPSISNTVNGKKRKDLFFEVERPVIFY